MNAIKIDAYLLVVRAQSSSSTIYSHTHMQTQTRWIGQSNFIVVMASASVKNMQRSHEDSKFKINSLMPECGDWNNDYN